VFAFSAAAACTEQKQPVPDLLKRALASPAASSELYAYDFEDAVEGDARGEATTSLVRGHVDLSREHGDRVIITFSEQRGDQQTDPEKLDERYERRALGPSWCDALSKEDVTNAIDKGPAKGGRAFAFTPEPEGQGEGDAQLRDIMKKMAAEAIVDEPTATLRSYSAALTRTHNVMFVFDILSASMKASCALAPNGRAYATRMEFKLSGAGLGQSVNVNSVQTISNLIPARNAE